MCRGGTEVKVEVHCFLESFCFKFAIRGYLDCRSKKLTECDSGSASQVREPKLFISEVN